MKCIITGSKLKIYGLTQNTETNEYMMVFQYANSGNLYKFLKTNFRDLNWQAKLKLLLDFQRIYEKFMLQTIFMQIFT
ncbi:hypothetical protein C2G38_2121643, partial [Gigaspora rosea]